MIVAGAAGVERGQNGAEAVAALGIGEQVPAIAESGIVVRAVLVGVPEIDERARKRAAGASENLSAQFDQPRLAVRLDEIGALGRVIRRARRGACPSWMGVMQADGGRRAAG